MSMFVFSFMCTSLYVLLFILLCFFFFFKQKTAYEMRISDWSSDVCSSDLIQLGPISKRGNGYLRRLLVNGAMSVLSSKRARQDPWLAKQIGRASCRERVCQYV